MNNVARDFYPYYLELYNKLLNEEFVIDKSGVKMVEIIAPRIVLDLNDDGFIDFESRKSPRKYIELEKNWYLSKSLSIDMVSNIEIWKKVCDKNEEINSNYGYLVYGRGNFNQFDNCVEKLKSHKESRQAIILYNRPSMHYEWNSFGESDFTCTLSQQFFIRNNKLECVTSMRSNDAIFGTFSDIPWFTFVAHDMFNKLLVTYPEIKLGKHIFIPNSFHCYEKHFDLLKSIVDNDSL